MLNVEEGLRRQMLRWTLAHRSMREGNPQRRRWWRDVIACLWRLRRAVRAGDLNAARAANAAVEAAIWRLDSVDKSIAVSERQRQSRKARDDKLEEDRAYFRADLEDVKRENPGITWPDARALLRIKGWEQDPRTLKRWAGDNAPPPALRRSRPR
jgi:hypothetical protein